MYSINNNNNNNDNNIITLFTLQNGSASTVIKAGIDPCVAIIKYSITSISMKKYRLLEKNQL